MVFTPLGDVYEFFGLYDLLPHFLFHVALLVFVSFTNIYYREYVSIRRGAKPIGWIDSESAVLQVRQQVKGRRIARRHRGLHRYARRRGDTAFRHGGLCQRAQRIERDVHRRGRGHQHGRHRKGDRQTPRQRLDDDLFSQSRRRRASRIQLRKGVDAPSAFAPQRHRAGDAHQAGAPALVHCVPSKGRSSALSCARLVDRSEGAYLNHEGIRAIKRTFALDIFRQDSLETYRNQTYVRDELKSFFRDRMEEVLDSIREGSVSDPELELLMMDLRMRLSAHKGKKVYGYLPKETKEIVDAVVKKIAEYPPLAEL